MSAAVPPPHATLQVCLFGPLDIRLNGTPISPIRSRKEQWLFALLVLRNDRHVTREWLAETLWPDHLLPQSLAYLRRAVYMLRQALGEEAHRLGGDGARSLRLNLSGAVVDLFVFDEAIKRADAESLHLAVEQYRGPLLEGCDEEWVQSERQVREQNYLDALEQFAELEGAGNLSGKIALLQRVILKDPLRESAHRSLMQAFADSGDLSAMITAYRDLRLMLRRELNAEPDPATTQLYEMLRSNPARTSPRPKPASPEELSEVAHPQTPQRRSLPRPLTKLIGRAREIMEVQQALADSRLVTLTGSGGVGKTRLAIKVAELLQDTLSDGVCYVDLTALSEADLVPQAIAASLGYKSGADTSVLGGLAQHLAREQILVVLDNCEHLIDACAAAAETLLQRCEGVRILATSQQPLGIMGETVWRTPTLDLPSPNDTSFDLATPEQAIGNAGICLFVERAAASCPGFTLSDRNVKYVIQIYRRLDGIPLAVELAAARLTVLSVEQIAAKLDDRFRLLTSGGRNAIPRQQTLSAAMDWSYELLDDAEQSMLQRLSVFAGGGTLDAVEALCDTDPQFSKAPLDLVQQLVDKSFVWTQPVSGAVRYRLLETTREYALKKLNDSGSVERTRRRHCELYSAQAAEACAKLPGKNAQDGRDWMDAEGDNVRAAIEWLIRPGAKQDDLDLCHAMIANHLSHLWQGTSHLSEARHWMERVLARSSVETANRADLASSAGLIAMKQGDIVAANSHFEAAMSTFLALGHERGKLKALNCFGKLAEFTGDYATARTYFEQCYDGFMKLDDERALRSASNNLGNAAMSLGDFAAAREYHEKCLEIGRKHGNHTVVAWSLDNLAEVCQAQDDFDGASALFKQSLTLFVMVGYRPGAADCIQGLGEIACRSERDVDGASASAKMLGAAEQMREATGFAVSVGDLPNHERAIRLARQAMGDVAFDTEWQSGRQMQYDDVVKLAMEH